MPHPSPTVLSSRTEVAAPGRAEDEYALLRFRIPLAAGLSLILGLQGTASPGLYPLLFRALRPHFPPLPLFYSLLAFLPASALLGLLLALPGARRGSRLCLVGAGLNLLVLACCLVAVTLSAR
jgi:hypothetical protein